MAGATLARKAVNVTEDIEEQVTFVSAWPVVPERAPWLDTLDASLRANLAQANHPQPNQVVEELRATTEDRWRIVTEGVIVRASEYEARFAHLDLETLRDRLTPEVFGAFVRNIGIMQGPDDVDVNMLVNEEIR